MRISFLEQLKGRNAGGGAILFAVIAYLALAVFETYFRLLDLPPWSGRLVEVLTVRGLPGVILFSWACAVTPGQTDVDRHWITKCPVFRSLDGDSRYKAFLQKLNLRET